MILDKHTVLAVCGTTKYSHSSDGSLVESGINLVILILGKIVHVHSCKSLWKKELLASYSNAVSYHMTWKSSMLFMQNRRKTDEARNGSVSFWHKHTVRFQHLFVLIYVVVVVVLLKNVENVEVFIPQTVGNTYLFS